MAKTEKNLKMILFEIHYVCELGTFDAFIVSGSAEEAEKLVTSRYRPTYIRTSRRCDVHTLSKELIYSISLSGYDRIHAERLAQEAEQAEKEGTVRHDTLTDTIHYGKNYLVLPDLPSVVNRYLGEHERASGEAI